MRKKIYSFFLMSMVALGVMAENATLDFTYAQGRLTQYGKGKKEDVDVAICINDPALAGKKITGIRAYINPSEGISNSSVWLTKELKLENKVNVADICNIEVLPSQAKIGAQWLNVLEVKLSEPYVLTTQPVYVGYSFTVDDSSQDTQKYPIIISEGINTNGFFVRLSKSVLKWTNYSQTAKGVAYIVAEIEGDYPDNAASLKSNETTYADLDTPFSSIFNITNIGINPIQSLSYSYSFDSSTEKLQGNVTLTDPVQPNLAVTVPVNLTFDGLAEAGTHKLNVTITEVNGQPNQSSQSSLTSNISVIPFRPVHRPLVEEFTGLWCGNCPRGYVAMEYLHENYYDDVVVACFHNNDPMAVTNNYPVPVAGFPEASINREGIIDPYWGSYESSYEMTILRDVQEVMDSFTIGDISLTAVTDGATVEATSETSFIQDLNNANYQIGFMLISNNLSDPNWEQENYYANNKEGWQNSPLKYFTTQSSSVKGLIFNDVVIDTGAMKGVENSLPNSITMGTPYNSTFTFDIKKNNLVQNLKDLVVTAFIIDKNTGRIINANHCNVVYDPSGIESILDSDSNVVNVEFYDLAGRKVVSPSNGIFIKVEKLSNGKFNTSKVFIR